MAECSKCGKQTMSFTCHYCGKKFCSEHRLPENHDCEGLESGKKEKYRQGSSGDGKDDAGDRKRSEDSSTQRKWFKDTDLKEEVRRGGSGRRGLLGDVKDTLKRNYTLSIIAVTTAFFGLHQLFPILKYRLMLFPNVASYAAQSSLYPGLVEALGYSPSLATQPWGILTVMIVHGGLFHLFANMVTFYFFGSTLEKTIGSRDLLKFYLGTGIAASLGYIGFTNLLYYLHGPQLASGMATMSPAVGASGAVVAAVGAVAMLYPEAEVLLYFIIPMRIKTAVYAFGALEVLNISMKLAGTTLPVIGGLASSAHLTGLVIGVLIGKKYREKVRRSPRVNIFR